MGDYIGDFEMLGVIAKGEHKQSTGMRFENNEHYEPYFLNIDLDYDADDILFTGFIYKI